MYFLVLSKVAKTKLLEHFKMCVLYRKCALDVFFLPPAFSQNCIDWNRDVLKRELGLEEEDIIDLPILFKLVEYPVEHTSYRALAYYPDMVCSDMLGRDGFPGFFT